MLEKADEHWVKKPDNLWFLRLMFFTGYRPEEIAQIKASDFAQINNQLCLAIHDRGSNHVKTEADFRRIPIHLTLLAWGLEGFIVPRQGKPLLFASLAADGRGRIYTRMQRRVTALLRNKAGIADPKMFRPLNAPGGCPAFANK